MNYVYVLANQKNTVLYIGVTNNLKRRLTEHKSGKIPGFTQKYKVSKLVYYEPYFLIKNAIRREKQLKGWRRSKKERLIRKQNPNLDDFSNHFLML